MSVSGALSWRIWTVYLKIDSIPPAISDQCLFFQEDIFFQSHFKVLKFYNLNNSVVTFKGFKNKEKIVVWGFSSKNYYIWYYLRDSNWNDGLLQTNDEAYKSCLVHLIECCVFLDSQYLLIQLLVVFFLSQKVFLKPHSRIFTLIFTQNQKGEVFL